MAAVPLAMKHLREQVQGAPIFIVGYSNGGALALQYTLTSLQDNSLPSVKGLILLSPEIGITKLAALSAWQEKLGHLLLLEKLAWNSISPEYDAYKYNSFALNVTKSDHQIGQSGPFAAHAAYPCIPIGRGCDHYRTSTG